MLEDNIWDANDASAMRDPNTKDFCRIVAKKVANVDSRGRFVGCVEVAIEHVRSAADGSVVRYRRFVAIDDLIRRAPLVRASGRGVEQLDGRNRELVDEVLRET